MKSSDIKNCFDLIERLNAAKGDLKAINSIDPSGVKIKLFIPDPNSMDGNGSTLTLGQIHLTDLTDILERRVLFIEKALQKAGVELD